MANDGLEKKHLNAKSKVSYNLYWRTAASVIAHQVRECNDCNIVTKFEKQDFMTHLLNAEIGIGACTAVKHEIKRSKDLEIFWRSETSDGISYTIECLQRFSDKYNTMLSAWALRFYPLHVTLLNVSDHFCKTLIASGRTVVAYLPVSFETNGRQERYAIDILYRRSSKTRKIILNVLYKSIWI